MADGPPGNIVGRREVLPTTGLGTAADSEVNVGTIVNRLQRELDSFVDRCRQERVSRGDHDSSESDNSKQRRD